jgi:superfamily II DNA or RNA helicase
VPPEPGQVVRVRQRRYLVEEVVPPAAAADSTLVRLACLDDDAQGQPLEALWEAELDAEVLTAEAWDAVAARGFDPPRQFAAYLHTLRWSCVTATDPRLFQAPFRAGIHMEAYQLEPLRKALRLPRVNLFIADDVGLGKTIEAGLIARELLLRKKVRDIVVACPPSVLPQWRDELETRFGLAFEVLDRDYVGRVRRERGYGINPWTTHSRFLVSQRLLVDEGYAGPLRDWLGDFRAGSLLILDEAHHAAPASGQRYAIDSRITRAVRDLAPRFEHRLFLSATPHNGHSGSFSALLEILDPQRFCRGVPVKGRQLLEDVMVRRLKEDIREAIKVGFPRRVVRQIDIDGLPADAPELRLSELLDRYRRLRERRLADQPKHVQAVGKLLICGLQQRLLSSVEAFARTLAVHRRTAERHWQETAARAPAAAVRQGDLPLLGGGVGADDERATLSEEQLGADEEAQFEAATVAGDAPTPEAGIAEERALLDEMARIAQGARGRTDGRVCKLVDWIRATMCPNGVWNDTRLVIFTEYEDTRRYLEQQLAGVVEQTERGPERIAVFHGPTPPERREEIKRAFNADPRRHPVRILIATDAAREGINLQSHCWNLFHFDLPWNPSRLEQRNGRIDRKLQPRDTVYCHYFVYRQRPEDRILQVLVKKTETIRRELGSLAQVIEGKLVHLLHEGIRHADVDRLEKAIAGADLDRDAKAVVNDELEAARARQDELRAQIDDLRKLLGRSGEWVGFAEGPFREALSCALELAGAAPLEATGQGRYRLPDLAAKVGADPTWADTLDTLRAPRRREQRFWEWRRESPIRPVVFVDAGTMTDEVVHLHLEHRVVQRLLGRFAAQGFVHHDLSRACLTHTSDANPRVILIGRLSLYGAGAARLHEELVFVTARWVDPKIRKAALAPYARDAESRTLVLLDQALQDPDARPVHAKVKDDLQKSAPGDVRDLLPALEERAHLAAADARARLITRGEQEGRDMRLLLERQQALIEATAAQDSQAQEYLTGLLPEEERQREANRRHWAKRLRALEHELEAEPKRVREVYAVRAQRVEPVGLVYLWPRTG